MVTDAAPEAGGALLRALAELAERTAVLAVQVPDTRAELEQVRERLDDIVRADGLAAIELERRLGALEAGLAAEARERDGVWAGAQRLAAEMDGRLRAALEVRDRAVDRWWRSVFWAVERIGLPLASAAAGALAARKGWLP